MNIIPWRRRDELTSFRNEMDSLWNRFFDSDGNGWTAHLPEVFTQTGFPRINLAETERAVVIEAELPGMDEKDIDVQLMGHTIVLSGERTWKEEKQEAEFRRVESEYGRFRREIPLPEALRLDADAIKATYEKGILKLEVPKLEPTPASKIKVLAK